ncbi:MAG TPA: hypothetical protein DIS74_09450 [Bacteroidales bacterium]|nr:hypothetical protein [Bacteroidales bacterium]
MRKLLLTLTALVMLAPAQAQEFIGLTGKKIRDVMASDNPGLTPDNSVRNNLFRYLKYHSEDENETWLIFLDDRDRCNGVRITGSIKGYEEAIKELNEKYRPEGLNVWTYRAGREIITVMVKKDAWYFTVTHERIHHL